jgi:hypothetical protein
MRHVFRYRAEAKMKGLNGQRLIHRLFSPSQISHDILREIHRIWDTH